MDRKHYLANFVYPASPVGVCESPPHTLTNGQYKFAGRYFDETLMIEGIAYPLEMHNVFSWKSILVNQDLICVDGEWDQINIRCQQITLLAPCYENTNDNDTIPPHPPTLITPGQIALQTQWQHFLTEVRSFFTHQGFMETQTPTLVTCPGTEPFLDVFETELICGREKQKKYLPTSPELHLKKLLTRGWRQIFEIRPCFRNQENSQTHQPEFFMLEWYRAYKPLTTIQDDLQKLILHLIEKLKLNNLHEPNFQSKTISQLFSENLNFLLQLDTTTEQLKNLCQTHQISTPSDCSWDDLFFFLFLEKIEKQISNQPLFVTNYPPSQAALARLTEDGWADRFEFYWQGLEIANAFCELNDPKTQRLRLGEDIEKKKASGRPGVPIDEDFLRHLEFGMPPSSGIALGLDRLFMALFQIRDIKDIKLFPY